MKDERKPPKRRYDSAGRQAAAAQRRLAVILIAWALLGPAVTALPDQTVILRGRSPLWAYPVDMAPRLALALGLVGAARRQLRRTSWLTARSRPHPERPFRALRGSRHRTLLDGV